MDKILVKNIIFASLILGLILGALAPIPYVGTVMLVIALVFSSPLIMLYFIMDGKYDLTTVTDSIINGAIIGFCVNVTFSFVYATIMYLLFVISHYSSNFFLSTMITKSPAWLILTFIIFIGVLCATTNAFSGFATHYVIELIRDLYEKNTKK
jgi:hypothetical protein